MKLTFLARLFASSVLVTTAFAPLTTFAATPQMALNSALMRLSDQKTTRFNLEANMTVNERPVARNGRATNVDLGFRMNVRTVHAENGGTDGEGTFDLMRFKAETKEGSDSESWSLDSPFTLNWVNRDNMSYIRFQSLPNSLVELARNEGEVDLTQIIGMWIGFESEDSIFDELENAAPQDAILGAETVAEHADLLKKYPPIQVLRVERRWKVGNDSIVRLRARINPNLVNALQRQEVADEIALSKRLGEPLAQRNKRIVEINTRYTELRRALYGISMAINLNETQGRLERLEMGGKFSMPQKEAGKTISVVDVKFSVGVNFLPLDPTAVQHPSYWRPFEEVLKLLEPPRPEPMMIEPMDESATIESEGIIIIQ